MPRSVILVVVLVVAYCAVGCAENEGADLTFTPVEWGIAVDDAGPGIHTISMVADVGGLNVDDLQAVHGTLVWDDVTVDLCAGDASDLPGNFVSVRDVIDGTPRIGDVFQSNSMGPGCDVNDELAAAFDEHDLPETACLTLRVDGADEEYCAPLD